MTPILVIIALMFLFAGLLGTIVPALPGLPLMFAGAWILAYCGDYEIIGSTTLIALGVITVIGVALDYIAGMLGAKFSGASKWAVYGSLIGAVIGVFFSLPGLIFGPILGAAAGELYARKDIAAAGKVGIATFAGQMVGVVAKIGCAAAILLTLAVMFIASLF